MPVHVVAFTDIVRYEGNTPIHKGRELVNEYYDTSGYKKLKPGDVVTPHRHRPEIVLDCVAADPFIADLTLTQEHTFGGPYATFYNAKNDTYYPMFLGDFIAMASQTIIVRGRVSGRFGYVKKNKNFGIVYLSED